MEERLHPAVQAPINLNAFVPVRELPEGPSAKLWHMRTPEHDNWCVDCLFKSITLLMVHQSDLSQIMKEVGDWRTVSDHPNITRFYDSVWDPHHHRLVIVSEFMNCFSLKEVMAYQTSGIPEEVVGVIMQQTVAGLAHLHSSVHRMHRNIKPSNIVLNSKGEVKITDLGQSAKLQHTLDACNTMIASQVYMSPERIQGANYTSNCDVWSLGIVMVEMITGKHPYDQGGVGLENIDLVINLIENSDPPVLIPAQHGVSKGAADLSAKCLVWSRERRQTSVELMHDEWLQLHTAPATTRALVEYLQSLR